MNIDWKRWSLETAQVILTIVVALLMGAVVMQLSGKDALEAYRTLFTSALGKRTAVADTLLAATPATSHASSLTLWRGMSTSSTRILVR